MRVVALVAVIVLAGTSLPGSPPPSTCGATDDYSRALCAYQRRQFADAERAFRAIVEAGVVAPETVKATYFLARTLMKTGRFSEATNLLIRIYEADKAFYGAWNCDFLLGECRRAMGKG